MYILLTRIAHFVFPSNPAIITYLAYNLWNRYQTSGKIEDLEESISLQQQAAALHPPGHPNRASSLNNVANCLFARYRVQGKVEDLEESISLHREAHSLYPPGHPDCAMSLNNLANRLSTRYEAFGKVQDLEESISLHHEVLSFHPPRHPDRVMSLNNLGSCLATRYSVFGRVEDIEEALLLHQEAITLHPPGHPHRASSLNNLANSLASRYEVLGKMEDLEDSVSLYRQALSLRPLRHPGRAMSLNNLANQLSVRYDMLGNIEDLEESISLYNEALGLRPPGHPHRSLSLNNLASSLSSRYEMSGEMEDLEWSISLHHEALSFFPPGHPDRPSSLNNLASNLSSRYNMLGKIADLEDSISFHREALSLRPPGNSARAMSLNHLSHSLSIRYEVFGEIEDLEESILLQQEALSLHSPDHVGHAMSLNNMANRLTARYGVLAKTEDLERSISLHYKALSLRPPGHPDHASSLNNLAINISKRYEVLGQKEDLEKSILLHHEALILHPLGHPDHAMSLNNLSDCLSSRYHMSGNIEDLESSISFLREVLTLHSHGHPQHSSALARLAGTLHLRYRHLRTVEDFQEEFLLYEQVARDHTSFVQSRLKAVVQWANSAREFQHGSIFSAYTTSLHLLNRCLLSHPSVESQQRFLATVDVPKSLVSDATSAAIEAGKIELAVEFLEQGRAMVWSRVDGYKCQLEGLRGVGGGIELADRFQVLGDELERLALSSNRAIPLDQDGSVRGVFADAQMKRHRILSEEWEAVLARIRGFEGFHDFLKALPFDTLRLAASEGPVILINISEYRSDAIILLNESIPVLIPLTELELNELHAQKLGSAREITKTLRYLWDNIASPVVVRLTELKIPKKSRIWWCPTGALCSFPLHAAGRGQKNLQDFYTSSYISTLSSLIKSRSTIVQSSAIPRLLVVGQPSTRQKLKRVKDEVDAIKALSPDDAVDVLFGPDAHSQAIIDGLKEHSWVHLACHGHLGDSGKPFQASFELHDRHLSLLDLIRARLPNAELAFLSACHSAEGDYITPDEIIHLSAALQFCGFKSVIGTLWEMDDEDGPVISKLFYEYMFRNPERIDFRDSAHALSFALKQMKEDGVPIDRLALFVHIGA